MPTLLLVIGLVLTQVEPVRFLPDDAQVTFRAMLPSLGLGRPLQQSV